MALWFITHLFIAAVVMGETTDETVPFYRYWNERRHDHFYTTDPKEIGTSDVYKSEGVVGKLLSSEQEQTGKLVKLFRYFKIQYPLADHFYTTNADEIGLSSPADIGKIGKHKYKFEGVAGQCFSDETARDGLVPLYRYHRVKKKGTKAIINDHFYTTDANEIGTTTVGQFGKNAYRSEGIACYIYPASYSSTQLKETLEKQKKEQELKEMLEKQQKEKEIKELLEKQKEKELREMLEKQKEEQEGFSRGQKKELSQLKETVREQGLLHKKHLSDLTTKQRKELGRLEKLLRKQKAAQKKQTREMGNAMKRHGERHRKDLLRAMRTHGATQREHIRDMKREILREMKHSFDRNNQRTVLLQKIKDIKHQQTNLELQHKIMTTGKQQQHELERQTNALIQRQIEWQKQSELQRKKRKLERQDLLRKQHEMRLKEHAQLMNGLKGFLMAFGRLYQHHVPPSPHEDPLKSIQKLGSGSLQQTTKRIQKKSKPKAINRLHRFPVAIGMNPNNRPIGYETEWTQYVPPATMQPPATFGMTNKRNFGDKSTEMVMPPPPPLMPPIPPIPSLRKRRLVTVDRDTLDFMDVIIHKCVFDERYGELCATYDSQNDVFSFDVMKLTEKRLKKKRDKNVMDHRDNNKNEIGYEPFGDLDDSLRDFIVYRYEFNHLYDGSQDIQCSDNDNSDVLPFKVCLILDKKQNDVLIYVDAMDDAVETEQNMPSMKTFEFMWRSDKNWEDIINIDRVNHIKKCRDSPIGKLCVVYDESVFIVNFFMQNQRI